MSPNKKDINHRPYEIPVNKKHPGNRKNDELIEGLQVHEEELREQNDEVGAAQKNLDEAKQRV
jgi:hypothetical protein